MLGVGVGAKDISFLIIEIEEARRLDRVEGGEHGGD